MRLLKKQHFSLALGVIGLLTCVSGTLLQPSLTQSLLFATGSGLLAVSAWVDGSLYFCLLSALASACGLLGIAAVPAIVKITFPIAGAGFCFFVLRKKALLNSLRQLYGGLGLLLLALGYAVVHPAVYFAGGFVLSTFAAVEFKNGVKIALCWAILNVVFCITSGMAVYRLYSQ